MNKETKMVNLDRTTLIEASYQIGRELLNKMNTKPKSIGYFRGYKRAATVVHEAMKKMIEDAK